MVLKSHNLDFVVKKGFVAAPLHMKKTEIVENKENLSLEEIIDYGYQENPLANRILQRLANGANYFQDFIIAHCVVIKSKLQNRDYLYIFDYHILNLHLCCFYYDFPHTNHLEIDNTHE